jgi:hypothetical protein
MRVSRFRDITSITQPSPAFSLRSMHFRIDRKKQRRTEKIATGSFAPIMIIPYERPWHFASVGVPTNVRFAPILLKKSLLVGERIFLAPLARPASGDVRDHIDPLKSDH